MHIPILHLHHFPLKTLNKYNHCFFFFFEGMDKVTIIPFIIKIEIVMRAKDQP